MGEAEDLLKGLDEAYRAAVPGGRYPPAAPSVTVDPRQVNVNVHPAKQLVRFSDEHGARRAVAEAVRRAISPSRMRSSPGCASTSSANSSSSKNISEDRYEHLHKRWPRQLATLER